MSSYKAGQPEASGPGDPPRFGFDIGRCVVADVESYPGRWLVGFHGPDRSGKPTTHVVDGDRAKLARALATLAERGLTLVTFNGDHYDVPVIRAILQGFDPYAIGTAIIKGERLPIAISSLPPLGVDHIDLAERVRRGRTFDGLKLVAARLGRPALRELPYPPGTILTDEQWDEVRAYNAFDLSHTMALLERFAPELQALAALSEEQGQDLRSVPTPRVVESVFLDAFRRARGTDPARPEVPGEVVYRGVPGVVEPRTPGAAAWYREVVGRPLAVVRDGEGRAEVAVPNRRFEIGRLGVSVGSGGLHSIDGRRVHYATRRHSLVAIDVSSFYPSLMATKGIAPRAYGDVGAATFRGILERRLEVKRLAKEAADPAERARLDIQASALKLVLNSTFGKLGDRFSSLFDPSAFLAVTISGQLMVIDLIERLGAAGARVLSANTDGLFLRVRRDDRRWREVLRGWESDTGMSLELDQLRRLVILATNIYATLDRRGNVKRHGDGLRGELGPKLMPAMLVVNDAVADALLRDVPPERTVAACEDPVRFCSVTKRGPKVVGAFLVDATDGSESELGKVNRWYKSRGSTLRIEHRLESGRKTTPPKATAIGMATDLVPGVLPDDLDRSWYIAEARKAIQATPGYRHRSLKRLENHPLALEAHARGLAPVPKWAGKAQPKGADRSIATYLWPWSKYHTVGTYTGPQVGILVLDVDVAAHFRRWVDRGNSPLLQDRWRDLDGCLVSCRGDATPEQVRTGRGRGKLIFRLESGGDSPHPLAKVAQAHWLKARGIEVFYGHGMPSVLGEHPDGTEYRLDGTLDEGPSWLLEGLVPAKRLPRGGGDPARPRLDPEADGHAHEPVAVDPARLDGLPGELARFAPELGEASVGWRTKDLIDDRTIWVGTCPFEHGSGTSTDGDLYAGYNALGVPYVRCMHTSCTSIPEVDRRLKEASRPPSRPAVEPPPINPTDITRAMLEDLDAGRVSRHHAGTGAGKTYSMGQVAALRWREDKATLIALPTVRLAEEVVDLLRAFAPDAFEAGAIATIYGRKLSLLDGDDDGGDDDGEEDCGKYPIDEDVRIVVSTHAQLGRRGFSRYLRGIWEKLAPDDKHPGRPVYSLIIDEAGEFLSMCRWEIPLNHRVKEQGDPDRSGGWLIPQDKCPKSSRSGNCGNCRLVKHGGNPRFNRYGIRELRTPPRIEVDAEGSPLYHPRSPLKVTKGDLSAGEPVKVGDTTFAAEVWAWRGRPIDEVSRRDASTYIFRRDRETGSQPAETPTEVLGHLLEFAHRPCVTYEFAVDEEGKALKAEDLAARIAIEDKRWDDGVTFPHRTCDAPRLLLTDLLAMEKIRRHAAAHGAGVIFAGATFGPDDAEVMRSVWPALVDREHGHPDRKLDRVAIVTPAGYHGVAALVGEDGRLVTAPLEAHGKGLVFCPRRASATALYEAVAMRQPSARLAVENHEQLSTRKTLHDRGEVPLGTFVTYSRGVLGTGANILHIRHLVVDANAFRAIGSFTPGTMTPEEFNRNRAEEQTALILQNVGRALRGEVGKTVVIIVLNADDHLLAALKANPAILQGCERPPVFATGGKDLGQLVDQAGRWLAAGGGDWPAPDPAKAKPNRAGRTSRKTREDVLATAEDAINACVEWRVFVTKHHPQRYLDAAELDALKTRFAEKLLPK